MGVRKISWCAFVHALISQSRCATHNPPSLSPKLVQWRGKSIEIYIYIYIIYIYIYIDKETPMCSLSSNSCWAVVLLAAASLMFDSGLQLVCSYRNG
jgi:hypothetical protein